MNLLVLSFFIQATEESNEKTVVAEVRLPALPMFMAMHNFNNLRGLETQSQSNFVDPMINLSMTSNHVEQEE